MAYSMTAVGAASANGAFAHSATVSGFTLGATDPTRLIVLGLHLEGSGLGCSAVTINGVSATLRVGATYNTTLNQHSWWEAAVPAGTSVSVVVGNGTSDVIGEFSIIAYSVINGVYDSTDVGGSANPVAAQPIAMTVTVPSGGSAAVMIAKDTTGVTQTMTWTGATNSAGDQQTSDGAHAWTGSAQANASGSVGCSISPGTLGFGGQIAWVPYGPSGGGAFVPYTPTPQLGPIMAA